MVRPQLFGSDGAVGSRFGAGGGEPLRGFRASRTMATPAITRTTGTRRTSGLTAPIPGTVQLSAPPVPDGLVERTRFRTASEPAIVTVPWAVSNPGSVTEMLYVPFGRPGIEYAPVAPLVVAVRFSGVTRTVAPAIPAPVAELVTTPESSYTGPL